MKLTRNENDELIVTLKNGMIAVYASGGYWHVTKNNKLVYGWVTAEFIRAN